ncbi:uncharacterized protein [Cherax quadricarinatus]|uniref:uncharacterized protein isoform X2 n=1 Tax=Cherax quadricarinatus TaxID=27406 RepID=UPI00387E9818
MNLSVISIIFPSLAHMVHLWVWVAAWVWAWAGDRGVGASPALPTSATTTVTTTTTTTTTTISATTTAAVRTNVVAEVPGLDVASVTGLAIVDETGRNVQGTKLGPFSDAHHLHLACNAHHGESRVRSLVWLLEGEEVDTSWEVTGPGAVTNLLQAETALTHAHHHAHLTCRLTTHATTHVAANITDVSTTITMFHVPEARITVWGKEVSVSETGHLATVGSDLTFLCSVTAHPPAYNVTWLHNGRVVTEGGRRWRRNDWELQVSQIRRADAGLYTCLASNTEGDGHSNALLLHVAHPPQCHEPGEHEVLVVANTSVSLTCRMDALPTHLTFTWTLADPPTAHQPTHDLRGGIITGDAPPPRHPGLIDLTPGRPPGAGTWAAPTTRPGEAQGSWDDLLKETPPTEGRVVEHRVHPHDPRSSSVTLTPTAPTQVFCYARNSVGRTTIPCTYLLTLVDPPQPIRDCNVTVVGVTRLEVKCHDLAPTESDQQEVTEVHHVPGISFVRSSGVRPTTNLEVWSGSTLVANVSSAHREMSVTHLPPDTPLQLLLYALTPHARSAPLRLHARTPPRPSVRLAEASTWSPGTEEVVLEDAEAALWDALDGMVVGGLLGGMGVLLLLLTLGVAVVRLRQQQQQAAGGSSNEADDAHADAHVDVLDEDALSHPPPPPPPLHHPHHPFHHSTSHSSLDVDARASVYCVGGSGEERRGDTPWQETSTTPLVALTTPLTPPPDTQVSPRRQNTCSSDAV